MVFQLTLSHVTPSGTDCIPAFVLCQSNWKITQLANACRHLVTLKQKPRHSSKKHPNIMCEQIEGKTSWTTKARVCYILIQSRNLIHFLKLHTERSISSSSSRGSSKENISYSINDLYPARKEHITKLIYKQGNQITHWRHNRLSEISATGIIQLIYK